MKTSEQWWTDTKADPAKLHDWLIKQHRGEVTAAERILAMLDKFEVNSKHTRTIKEIAKQEEFHAKLVLKLLTDRGIEPSVEGAEDRYWKEVLPAAIDFETTAAIGAHAERMRLERINAIVADRDAPVDIRVVFAYIQKQEMWHTEAFARMAGSDALRKTIPTQEQGRAVLGLEP